VLSRLRVAVFVDGCYWHACPEHMTIPKSNPEWWKRKLDGNVERDRRNDAKLTAMGWEALHVWEHEDPEIVADQLTERWRASFD